ACCRRPSSAVPKWCRFWRTDYVRYSYDSNDGAHHAAPHHRLLPQGHGGGAAVGLGRAAGAPLVGRVREMSGEKPLSGVERIKQQSNGLRGEVAAELAQRTTHVSDERAQLLKFHGRYPQEDREQRGGQRGSDGEPGRRVVGEARDRGGWR